LLKQGPGSLRAEFEKALRQLSDAEGFFLRPDILNEPRTPAALQAWLDNADMAVQIAIQQRMQAQAALDKYGPNCRAF
jgi:hypothetical protein